MASMEPVREFLRHTLATLAYRAGKVVRDAPDGFASLELHASSRTPLQILAHINDLLAWARSMAAGQQRWEGSAPQSWDSEVQRFFAEITALDESLAGEDALACPAEKIFQGPIADAFTHVGQIALLRRVGGRPVRGENYFRAEIVTGRVGPEQAPPIREFD